MKKITFNYHGSEATAEVELLANGNYLLRLPTNRTVDVVSDDDGGWVVTYNRYNDPELVSAAFEAFLLEIKDKD